MKNTLGFLSLIAFSGLGFASHAVSAQTTEFELVWSLSPGERTYLTTNGRQRGMAVHPDDGYVVIVHRQPVAVPILNGLTGADEGALSTSGISGGNFVLNKIAIAEDGTIYACNMTTDTAVNNFRLYRWADKNATPELVFNAALNSGDGNPSNRRFGDSLVVKGTGESTEIFLSSWDATIWARLTPMPGGEEFAAQMVTVMGIGSGTVRDIALGPNNLFYGSRAAAGMPVHEIEFDPNALTASSIRQFDDSLVPAHVGPVGVDTENGFFGGIHAFNSIFNLYHFDKDPLVPLQQITSRSFPTNNLNDVRSGIVAFHGDMIYALETNNGIMAMRRFEVEPGPVQAGSVIWTNADTIMGAGRTGGNRLSHATGFSRAIGIAADAEAEQVYFADDDGGVIGRVNFDGSGREDLLFRSEPQSLALTEDRIFWVEYWSGVFSADRNGGDVQQVIFGFQQSALAIDRIAGKIYVASTQEFGSVQRANLDGSEAETLFHITLPAGTHGMAIDGVQGILYTTSYQASGAIIAHDLATGVQTPLYEGRPYPLGIVLSEDGSQLFWAERNVPAQPETAGRVLTAPAVQNGPIQELASTQNSPFGVALVPLPGGNFAAWIAQFGLPSDRIGPQDDADGDGVANIVEYALAGGHPGAPNRAILPTIGFETENGDSFLTLAVNRNAEAAGVTSIVEVSGDLETWFSGPDHTTVLVDTPAELVVRDNAPIGAENRRFIRLRVVEE